MRIFCLNWCSAGTLCNISFPFLEFIPIVLSFFLLPSYLIESLSSSSFLSNVWLSSTRANVARLTKNPEMYVSEIKNLLNSLYKVCLFSKIIDEVNKNQMKKYYIPKLTLIISLKNSWKNHQCLYIIFSRIYKKNDTLLKFIKLALCSFM